MKILNYRGWAWIENNTLQQDSNSITGKYLFFSDSKDLLIDLAKKVLDEYDLLKAKVPSSDIPNNSKGFGFVLCIYDTNNKYCDELKKLETNDISFRYWKSDNTTRAGKYSKQYMNN